VLQRQLDQWELVPDGDPVARRGSIVQPVRTPDGTRAVLKIGRPDAESEHEHLVLRRWGGAGAVRLLSADPPHRALLLERLNSETLRSLRDVDACDVVAGLYGRLHVPAMPQLRSLASELELWTRELESLPRSAAVPRRLVEQAIGLGRDLSTEPATVVLHGNLHYGTVLAADREAWLAIAPTPRNGDPHYDLAPMLWHRWSDVAGDVRETVRRRFFRLLDASGLDEERARGWAVVRVVQQATRDPANLTTYVAVAKAIAE
jgi:streptomycin 6-kinase